MIVRFVDLPELSPMAFQPDKGVGYLRIPTPCWLDLASGLINVDDDFYLVGRCTKMHEHVSHGREGQVGIMLFCEEYGEVWEHYPLWDEDEREAANFSTKRGLLESEATKC